MAQQVEMWHIELYIQSILMVVIFNQLLKLDCQNCNDMYFVDVARYFRAIFCAFKESGFWPVCQWTRVFSPQFRLCMHLSDEHQNDVNMTCKLFVDITTTLQLRRFHVSSSQGKSCMIVCSRSVLMKLKVNSVWRTCTAYMQYVSIHCTCRPSAAWGSQRSQIRWHTLVIGA